MKILCLPYTHTLSHISRPLAIAVELRKRGHTVIFAGESPHDRFIRGESFDVLPAYQIAPEVLFGRIRDGKLQFVNVNELQKMITADLELYSQVEPDLVLSDGRFSAPISTGIARLKHAAVVNVSSTAYRALPYIPFFDWLPGSQGARSSVIWQNLDKINLWLEMLVFNNAARSFKTLSEGHTLRRKVTATNCLTGNDLTLMADTVEYFPTRNLPNNYHYIGPLTWKSPIPPPLWWPPKKTGDLLVYITMGTTWMGGSFSMIYDLVRDHQITAIIAAGGQAKEIGEKGLQSIEGLIYVEDFVNGDLIMKECDLVVCHGGNGTIYQALQEGKPIVGIPTIPDQSFNMRRVKTLGVGESMTLKELEDNPQKLFQLVVEVARDPRYRENAQKFKEKLSLSKPAEKAADLIERTFRSG